MRLLSLTPPLFAFASLILSFYDSNAQYSEVTPIIFKGDSCIDIKKTVDPEQRLRYLRALYANKQSDACFNKKNEPNGSFDYFVKDIGKYVKLIDLNNDGTYELLFDGMLCGGHESGVVEIYTYQGDTLNQVLSRGGKVLCVTKSQITIYKYSCCASNLNIIEEFSLKDLSKEALPMNKPHLYFSATTEREGEITLFGGPFLPEKINSDSTYIRKDSITLRWTPNTVDYCLFNDNYNTFDNSIISLKPKAEYKLLYDSDTSNWQFVKVKLDLNNTPLPAFHRYEKYLLNYGSSGLFNVYGWIQKE